MYCKAFAAQHDWGAALGGLTCLLIKADPARDEIATFKLDRATAAALGKFQQPKRYAQFRRETAEGSATAAWRWGRTFANYAPRACWSRLNPAPRSPQNQFRSVTGCGRLLVL
jgi:hypothetical protein